MIESLSIRAMLAQESEISFEENVCAVYQSDTAATIAKAQAQVKRRMEVLQHGKLCAGSRSRLPRALPLYGKHVAHRLQQGDPITPAQIRQLPGSTCNIIRPIETVLSRIYDTSMMW